MSARHNIAPVADVAGARRAWCLYDWANSAFAATVMAALFPPFFSSLAQAAGASASQATAYWGYITAGTLLVIALSAPLLGAFADFGGTRKRFLGFFAAAGILATALMSTLGADSWRAAAILFVVANFGFSGSFIFYESLLPQLASGKEMDRLSAKAYALGYAGGGLLLIINLMMVSKPLWFGLSGPDWAVRLSFVTVAIWWAVFSLPLFRKVPEPISIRRTPEASQLGLKTAFSRLIQTLKEIRRYRQLSTFLLAYWIYNDGIGTIIKMATIYGAEIGIGMTDLMGAMVLTQLIGIPFALLLGRLSGFMGVRKTILLTLVAYGLISIGGFFMANAAHFYILAAMVGMVQGGAQALSRSLFASMVPRHRTAEFFGFYSTSGKLAGVVGPLIFGLVGHLAGTSRLGILSLVFFFTAGAWLLLKVDVAAGRKAALKAEHEAGFSFDASV